MRVASHSDELRQKIRLVERRLDDAVAAFWGCSDIRRRFHDYLLLLYSIIRTSVPLMQTAAGCAREKGPADPVAVATAGYLQKHIREEMHHDDWLLEDMEAIGMRRAEILAELDSPAVAGLVGAQYYWARHVHPVALFGYIAVMEGQPPTFEGLAELQSQTGLPDAAFRTLRKHATLDPHHRDELYEQVDRLPLTDAQTALVGISAVHTLDQLSAAFDEISGT